jgi:uncharacterized protein (DUF983 family)
MKEINVVKIWNEITKGLVKACPSCGDWAILNVTHSIFTCYSEEEENEWDI